MSKANKLRSPSVPVLATMLLNIIRQQRLHNQPFTQAFNHCLATFRNNIDAALTAENIEEMLTQYLLTRQAFAEIFANPEWRYLLAIIRLQRR